MRIQMSNKQAMHRTRPFVLQLHDRPPLSSKTRPDPRYEMIRADVLKVRPPTAITTTKGEVHPKWDWTAVVGFTTLQRWRGSRTMMQYFSVLFVFCTSMTPNRNGWILKVETAAVLDCWPGIEQDMSTSTLCARDCLRCMPFIFEWLKVSCVKFVTEGWFPLSGNSQLQD